VSAAVEIGRLRNKDDAGATLVGHALRVGEADHVTISRCVLKVVGQAEWRGGVTLAAATLNTFL
jgi:hypothetical protein